MEGLLLLVLLGWLKKDKEEWREDYRGKGVVLHVRLERFWSLAARETTMFCYAMVHSFILPSSQAKLEYLLQSFR